MKNIKKCTVKIFLDNLKIFYQFIIIARFIFPLKKIRKLETVKYE